MQKIDIAIVKGLQSISNGFLDVVFKIITFFGDPLFFIIIGVLIYWLYSKKEAFKLVLPFLLTSVVVGVIKVIVARPRPFKLEGIRSIGEETQGFSFPSGHSQGSGFLFAGLKDMFNKRAIFYSLLAILILVPVSRMYLGQHYFTDVLVGTALGVFGFIGFVKLIDLMGEKEHIYSLYLIIPAVIGLVVLLILQGKATDQAKFYNDFQDLFKMIGAYVAFAVAYFIEKVYIKHNVNSNVKVKVLKVLLGLLPLLLIYFGLSAVLPKNGLSALIKYFIVAFWAVAGAPFLFTKVFSNEVE